MKLLSETKRKKGKKWAIMTDPFTQEKDPKRLSVDCFSDGFYKAFFTHNNLIVKWAVGYGIDLGEEYERFFEQGLRVSQQIDEVVDRESGEVKELGIKVKNEYGDVVDTVSFRDRCREVYENSTGNLEKKLIKGIKEKRIEERNKQYDSLLKSVEGKLNQEDFAVITNLINELKGKEIIEYRDRGGEYAHLEQRLYDLKDYKNDELMEFFPKVDDKVKVLFLQVFKHNEFHDKRGNLLEYGVKELVECMEKIGPENSKIYLNCLIMALDRNENLYLFHKSMDYEISKLEESKQKNYLAIVNNLMSTGCEGETAVYSALGML